MCACIYACMWLLVFYERVQEEMWRLRRRKSFACIQSGNIILSSYVYTHTHTRHLKETLTHTHTHTYAYTKWFIWQSSVFTVKIVTVHQDCVVVASYHHPQLVGAPWNATRMTTYRQMEPLQAEGHPQSENNQCTRNVILPSGISRDRRGTVSGNEPHTCMWTVPA